jgi:hypothetical protein
MSRLTKLLTTVAVILVSVLIFAWSKLNYPYSYAEAIFLSNLNTVLSNNLQKINLAELMPTEWETVCESHGYDEPLYLEKYRKNFPTAGGMQDAAWGLIFIKPDSSFDLISSSCGAGAALHFSNERCLPRERAILIRDKNTQNGICKVFTALHEKN